jgi:predicted phage-related endonuclease
VDHPFYTPYQLWALKTGRIKEDKEENEVMWRGNVFEDAALKFVQRVRPEWEVRKNNDYFCDPTERMGATPDAFAFATGRGLGVIQVKTVSGNVFVDKWQGGDKYGAIVPPMWVLCQAQIEAHLAAADWASVAALTITNHPEIYVVEMEVKRDLITALIAAVRKFWKMIEDNIEPEPDFAVDSEAISRVYAQEYGTRIDKTDRADLAFLHAQRLSSKQAIKQLEQAVSEIDAQFRYEISTHAVMALPEGRGVTCRESSRRNPNTGTSTTFRTLRYTGGKNAAE